MSRALVSKGVILACAGIAIVAGLGAATLFGGAGVSRAAAAAFIHPAEAAYRTCFERWELDLAAVPPRRVPHTVCILSN